MADDALATTRGQMAPDETIGSENDSLEPIQETRCSAPKQINNTRNRPEARTPLLIRVAAKRIDVDQEIGESEECVIAHSLA